jgi:hypothetical protein
MRRRLPPEPVCQSALWSQRVALFAGLVAFLAVALTRAHKFEPLEALATLGSAVALALGALLLFAFACAAIWRSGARGLGAAFGGLFLAGLTLAYPTYLAALAVRYPVLSEVSTDIADPPDFSRSRVALAARRGFTPKGVADAARAAQRAAYPDVEPIVVDIDLDEAIALVLKTGAARGWRLVEQRRSVGRSGDAHVDFLDSTRILGFDEDVTVRLHPLAGQTRIDMRAATRYGRHDFGANAQKIMSFADELQSQLDQR